METFVHRFPSGFESWGNHSDISHMWSLLIQCAAFIHDADIRDISNPFDVIDANLNFGVACGELRQRKI